MLDFSPVRAKKMTIGELVKELTPADLRRLTNEMVDEMQELLAGCVDADVTFTPEDPEAYDSFTDDDALVNLPWTLGHVIVHTTASAEESAALAAELARGVPYHGRSRSEAPWEKVTTIAQCRARLEESRRMRLAGLDMWPERPDLNNTYQAREGGEQIDAIIRFVYGLSHDDSHLEQIGKIVRQAKAARR